MRYKQILFNIPFVDITSEIVPLRDVLWAHLKGQLRRQTRAIIGGCEHSGRQLNPFEVSYLEIMAERTSLLLFFLCMWWYCHDSAYSV
jgi:hypothetical protein